MSSSISRQFRAMALRASRKARQWFSMSQRAPRVFRLKTYASPEKQTTYRAGRSSRPPFFRDRKDMTYMKRPASPQNKYFLRDLHHEIDLYDRKLAYLSNFAEFAST